MTVEEIQQAPPGTWFRLNVRWNSTWKAGDVVQMTKVDAQYIYLNHEQGSTGTAALAACRNLEQVTPQQTVEEFLHDAL